MILQSVIKRKLKKPAPLRISAPLQCEPDVRLTNTPDRIPHLQTGGCGENGVLRRRRGRKCCQLSMVDILRFHNEFHFSLHLQDHLRFSMGNFEGEWPLLLHRNSFCNFFFVIYSFFPCVTIAVE